MIDTPGNNAGQKEGTENPFDAPALNIPPYKGIHPHVHAVIAALLLLPAVMVFALTPTMDMMPQNLQGSVYIKSLILNLPSSIAILFLPIKSPYKCIAAIAYWLILSPAVLGSIFAVTVFISFAFGY